MLNKRRKQKWEKDRKDREKKEKRNAYNTRLFPGGSTHPSTDRARRCLTSVIGREPVFSTWYGRRQQMKINKHSYTFTPHFMQISTHIHNIHVKWIVNKRYI